ncbi:hypothetical protein P691DRAFT_760245 [Macrolepiota fuliginosa MF-IS2]|uniref:Uncharacterized protein n=1 Tax=Macrolepiota fuliginosa MF-IS2 TaxID=1400762 RepID=A0A9P5XDX0_9AGAR|nr:hypothetical protein P691DRAFT_760245 [Macrolepiota fuliginosa MF-IS2]
MAVPVLNLLFLLHKGAGTATWPVIAQRTHHVVQQILIPAVARPSRNVDHKLSTLFSSTLALTPAEDLRTSDDTGHMHAGTWKNRERRELRTPPLQVPPSHNSFRERFTHNRAKIVRPGLAPSTYLEQSSTGYVGVFMKNTPSVQIGWLQQHKIVPAKEGATLYTYKRKGRLMEIRVADQNTNLRMAVVSGFYGQRLERNSKNFHLPRHTTAYTPANDVPFHHHDVAQHVETTVFSLNPTSGEIQVLWVNPDRSKITPHVVIYNERLYYAGNIHLFGEYVGGQVEEVIYKWIPMYN